MKPTLKQDIENGFDGEGPFGFVLPLTSNVLTILAASVWAASTVESLGSRWATLFTAAELIFASIFFFEYLARIWSSVKPMRYIFSFWGLIDLIASLPFLLLLGSGTTSLRALRVARIARVLRLLRLRHAQERLSAAFLDVKEELMVFLILATIVLFFASAGIYVFENAAQPDVFSSVPKSAWWAIATLTTVGYGDIYPITIAGQMFTVLILIVGLAVVAVPTGLISASLMANRPKQ